MTFERMVERVIKIKRGIIKPAKNELKFKDNDIDKLSIANNYIKKFLK